MARIKFTCPFCSLFCDDLEVSLTGNKLGELTPSCSLAWRGLKSLSCFKDQNEVQGKKKPFEFARDEICRMLEEARYPLVYLSGEISCEEQRAAVEFGKYWNAVVDTPGSAGGCALAQAINRVGWQSANLADAKGAGALLAFDPDILEQFPRLIDSGRREKLGIVIPEDLPVSKGGDYAGYFHEKRWQKYQRKSSIHSLFSIAGSANGVYFIDQRLIGQGETAIQEMLSLMKSSDETPGCRGMILAHGANAQGAVDALQSLSGYPACVRFLIGKAEFSAQDFAIEKMIKNMECDLVLLMGYPSYISGSILKSFKNIKTILFSSEDIPWEPEIQVPIKHVGLDGSGTVLRTDGIALYLPGLVISNRPDLRTLLKSLKRRKGA